MKSFTALRASLLLTFTFLILSSYTAGQTTTPTPPIQEEDQVVKVESRLVIVPVAVTNQAGDPVMGLTAKDFRLTEENAPQIIDSVGNADTVPLEIALLIDVSGSVNPLFEFEKKAAGQFLQTVMKPEDRATIFLISDNPTPLLQSESAALAAERLKGVVPVGKSTAFYDATLAAAKYLREKAPVRSLRVIVAITDGEDNWSEMVRDAETRTWKDEDLNRLTTKTLNQNASKTDVAHQRAQTKVSRELQDADTVFYVINPAGTSIKLNKISMRAQTGMEKFANETGGTFFLPAFAPTSTKDPLLNAGNQKRNEATLDRIFKQLASDLRAQYLVQYYSESDYPANKFVKLSVALQNPAGTRIRSRQGYYVKK
jgi:Ca-activated chloride channel family protein